MSGMLAPGVPSRLGDEGAFIGGEEGDDFADVPGAPDIPRAAALDQNATRR